jgi:hypothetical protein
MLTFYYFRRRLEVVETLVILCRLPRRRFVHVEHILGAPEDDSTSSRVREVRVLASPQQALPMGRWNKELVPRKLQMIANILEMILKN